MESPQDENIAPDDLINKCACCFKVLKKQDIFFSLNDELEAIFCDVIQLEFYSKAYAKYICEICNNKLLEFSKFKNELSINQQKLYESLIVFNHIANPIVKMEPPEEFDDDEHMEEVSGMEWNFRYFGNEEDEKPMPHTSSKRGRKKTSTSSRPTIFTCPICKDKTFTSRKHYRIHLDSEHPDRKDKSVTVGSKELCTVCAKWISTNTMDVHIKRMHTEGYSFLCDLCPLKFKVKRDLNHHMRIHMGKESRKRFQCEYCENSYLAAWNLRNHITMQHTDIPKDFICECGSAFKTQMSLNYHRKTVHTQGEFPCTVCNKMFTSLPNLRVHTAHSHGVKEPCVVCGKMVAPGSFMNRHLRTHAPTSFQCPIEGCIQIFADNTSLINHQASVHGIDARVHCDICGSTFTTKKGLYKHKTRTHTVTEKVPCEVPGCSFSAVRKDIFIAHIKSHKFISNEKTEDYIRRIKAMKLPW